MELALELELLEKGKAITFVPVTKFLFFSEMSCRKSFEACVDNILIKQYTIEAWSLQDQAQPGQL